MGKTVHITRRVRFNAAHRLWVEGWSDERNEATFGKCGNANWHGHNFDLYVTVKGVPDPETGYFINFTDFKRILKEHVVEELDHRNLNLDVSWLRGIQPTTEQIAVAIWERLQPVLAAAGCTLHCVRLHETENNSASYYGE